MAHPRNKMWFGQEGHFQWVPMPETGMQVSHNTTYQSMQYQNGRFGSHSSKQAYKSYEMNFPVQEAHGLEGLDVFQKFASGFWRDPDKYPFFFADPMNFQKNLFPPNWAAPGLYDAGWSSPVWNASGRWRNLFMNPLTTASVGADSFWTFSATTTNAQVADTDFPGGFAYQTQRSSGTGSITVGIGQTGGPANRVPVQPSRGVQVRLRIKTSTNLNATVTVQYYNAANGTSSINDSVLSGIALTANVAQDVVFAPTAWSGAVTARVTVGVGTVPTGITMRIGGVQISTDATGGLSPEFFAGGVGGGVWDDAPNASSSSLIVTSIPVSVTDTPANSSGFRPTQITQTVSAIPNSVPTYGATEANRIPFVLLPIPPGHTLWLSAAGSATGTAEVAVSSFSNDSYTGVPTGTQSVPFSTEGSPAFTRSIASTSADYVKVFIRRTSGVPGSVTLSSMVAQLWPTGVTPTYSYHEGMGHRGLKFDGTPTVESYVMVDPMRQVPVHYKGLSATLTEAQEAG